MDEEAIAQEHEETGAEITTCDLCGRLVTRTWLTRVAGQSGLSEPVEELHVCAECYRRIEVDDLPFEEEIGAGLQPADA